jgi:hypothetical protein
MGRFGQFWDGDGQKRPCIVLYLKRHRTCLTHLKSFKKQVNFSDIEPGFVKDFFRYMQTELEIGGAACKKYMDTFKKVIKQARKENYLDPTQMEFLFDDVKIKVGKAKRTFLEPGEKWTYPRTRGILQRIVICFYFRYTLAITIKICNNY